MKFGLEPKHWSLIEKLVLTPLKARGAQVWIFGSRARGDHQKFSDLDVLYTMPQELSFVEQAKITQELEESLLPIKVEVVFLENLASSYRAGVLKDRVEV
jgi:uncharacterized protein